MENLKTDGKRLWDSLMEMAKIGATKKGGVCRLALTDLDLESRRLFSRWAEEAGCTVSFDAMGNIFARRPGRNPDAPPILTGSHLDSQPTGGKFDGAYGVLAGLEVVRSLNDQGVETESPVEVVVWTNEEGSRFPPAMIGSGAFAGVFDLDYAQGRADQDGRTIGQELERIGYRGEGIGGRPVGAYFEAHIEQGPILEAEEKTIGVVTGAQGQRWYEITLTGQEAHAGPTPMARRHDALVGAAQIVARVNELGLDFQPDACATVGMLEVRPNSRNVIPGQVWLTVDLRHPTDERLYAMDQALRAAATEAAEAGGLSLQIEQIWQFDATPFDSACVDAVRVGAERIGATHRDIVSGAGHDAVYMARVAPTGMIFVPCEDGISHNEIENATPDDLAAGCEVLFHAIVERAGGR
ncbi:MAG: Zn-dependent hydrolase [Pseudomonadota bacterium]